MRFNRQTDPRTQHPRNSEPLDSTKSRRVCGTSSTQSGKFTEPLRAYEVPKPHRKSPVHQSNDQTRYIGTCKPAWKTNIQPNERKYANSTPAWAIFSLNRKRRIASHNVTNRKLRGPDRYILRRLVRRREFPVTEQVTSLTLWNSDNVEFSMTGCSITVHHRSRVHSMFQGSKRLTMDTTATIGTREREGNHADTLYGQRAGTEIDQDPNVPSQNSTHRASIPLYPGISGSGTNQDGWNQGQGQPSGSTHEATTDELD